MTSSTRTAQSLVKASGALEALCDYALYKSTFTLHYITFTSDTANFLQLALSIAGENSIKIPGSGL